MTMMDMIYQNKMGEEKNRTNITPRLNNLSIKIQELNNSVTEVQKYELLTTNQYIKQMEILLQILKELTIVLNSSVPDPSLGKKTTQLKH